MLPDLRTYVCSSCAQGSTFKRRASPEEREKKSPTFKDLDFAQMHPEGFTLSPEHYDAVSDSLSRDVKVHYICAYTYVPCVLCVILLEHVCTYVHMYVPKVCAYIRTCAVYTCCIILFSGM